MFKKRYFKKEDKKAIIDIDDFIVTYGAEKIGEENPNLAQTIYNAAKGNLKGLDKLFKDQGFGRIHKFQEIAQGFVSNLYNLNGKEAQPKVNAIMREAIAYLGAHAKAFNKWKLA